MTPEKWITTARLVLDTNFGGYQVDICADCGALVPIELRTIHEESHQENPL